jgi:hypothetical protein
VTASRDAAEIKETAMKYMILTYGSQQDYDGMAGRPGSTVWTPADFEAMDAFMAEFNRGLEESGELVETRALLDPAHTRRVRLQNGIPVATDGPYAETEEVLAGYWIVDVADFDRATELAGRLSECPAPDGIGASAYADVRPIVESREELS